MTAGHLTSGHLARTSWSKRLASAAAPEITADDERLFLLLGEIRCASAATLHTLHFATTVTYQGGAPSERTTRTHLARLVNEQYLRRTKVALYAGQVPTPVYSLAGRAIQATSLTRTTPDNHRRLPGLDIVFHTVQRSALWAALTADGFSVGCDGAAQLALRRNLVDRQRAVCDGLAGPRCEAARRVLSTLRRLDSLIPPFQLVCRTCGTEHALFERRTTCTKCEGVDLETRQHPVAFECPRCGVVTARHDLAHLPCQGQLHKRRALPFDVAWRHSGELYLLLVDHPRVSLWAQLDALPLRTLGQPSLPVVLRPSDDESLYDAAAKRWIVRGKRFRNLLRSFEPDANHVPGRFPFSTTSHVVDYRPELALRVTNRKSTRHEEVAEVPRHA